MNALKQLDSGILGSAEAVTALQRAENVRLLILSDTHGHYTVVDAILREFGPVCDGLLFAGDGMWDIVQYIENAQDSEKIRESLPPVVAFVAGNGDGEQYRVNLRVDGVTIPDPEDTPGYTLNVPSRQIIHACGYSLLLVHGHRHSVDVNLEILVDTTHAMDCDIAIYGHTHIPYFEEFSHIVAVNPGSPAKPRGHSQPGFAVIDLDATATSPKVTFYAVNEGARGKVYFEELFRA